MAKQNDFYRRFSRNWSGLVGLVFLILLTAVALAADKLYPGSPLQMAGQPMIWPFSDAAFPLGTDRLGRDLAAQLAHGARISLMIGLSATVFALLLGLLVGSLAGYFRGWVDSIVMRFCDLVATVPPFLLALVIVAVLGPSTLKVALAIGVSSWPPIARIVRAECLALREREFVLAAVTAGMSDLRIVLTQVLPNAMTPVIVMSSILVASAILNESSLAFLGFTDPNTVSWGIVIGNGKSELRTAWYIVMLPGFVILLTVLALNQVNDALNDALNPQLKDR
jgi:peptide/nickel transport system permease protein